MQDIHQEEVGRRWDSIEEGAGQRQGSCRHSGVLSGTHLFLKRWHGPSWGQGDVFIPYIDSPEIMLPLEGGDFSTQAIHKKE